MYDVLSTKQFFAYETPILVACNKQGMVQYLWFSYKEQVSWMMKTTKMQVEAYWESS